jgi:hypothetical protein
VALVVGGRASSQMRFATPTQSLRCAQGITPLSNIPLDEKKIEVKCVSSSVVLISGGGGVAGVQGLDISGGPRTDILM